MFEKKSATDSLNRPLLSCKTMPVGLGWLLGFRRRRDWTPRAALALEARRGRRAWAGAERGAGAVRCGWRTPTKAAGAATPLFYCTVQACLNLPVPPPPLCTCRRCQPGHERSDSSVAQIYVCISVCISCIATCQIAPSYESPTTSCGPLVCKPV